MNLPKNKHVHVFDFDETLCQTNAKIGIKDLEQGIEFLMHPTDYPDWALEGWLKKFPNRYELDFSNFRGYPIYGTPIKNVVTLLKILLTSDEDLCVLVTGRDELSGPRAWLLNNEIDVDKMILMCSGNPDKRMCYESVINTLQPSAITIYEDTETYINQCKEVCKKYEVPYDYKLIRSHNE